MHLVAKLCVVQLKKKKKKILIIPNGFPKGSKCKRNFKNASENDRNTLSQVKDTTTPETPPVD